jgi:hypothetical protein
MSIQAFGVTQAVLEAELEGLSLSGVSGVATWIQEAAAEAYAHLRQQGYDSDTVGGWGTDDPLYVLASSFVKNRALAKVLRAITYQDTNAAKSANDEADRIAAMLRTHTESVTPNWDEDEQRGSAHWAKSTDVDPSTAPRPRSIFRRGMSF